MLIRTTLRHQEQQTSEDLRPRTIVKMHPNPVQDVYEVIHHGETVGFYWTLMMHGNQVYRAVGRGAQSLGDHVNADAAVAAIVAAA